MVVMRVGRGESELVTGTTGRARPAAIFGRTFLGRRRRQRRRRRRRLMMMIIINSRAGRAPCERPTPAEPTLAAAAPAGLSAANFHSARNRRAAPLADWRRLARILISAN